MAYSHVKKILTGQSEATPETRLMKASEAIKPGMLIALDSNDQWLKHAGDGGPIVPAVALPKATTETPDVFATATAFSDGESIAGAFPQRGDKACLWLAPSQTIVIGDVLISNGAGLVKKYATQDVNEGGAATVNIDTGNVVGVALEAVTTDGSTTSPIAVLMR